MRPAEIFKRRETAWRKLVAALDALGFFKHVIPDDLARVKEEAIQAEFLFHEEIGRAFHLESEDVAEGMVADFLANIQPFLGKNGVTIRDIAVTFEDEQDYAVNIDGVDYLIYSSQEIEAHNLWTLSAARTCHIVNVLLIGAGSEERTYRLSGCYWGRLHKNDCAHDPGGCRCRGEETPDLPGTWTVTSWRQRQSLRDTHIPEGFLFARVTSVCSILYERVRPLSIMRNCFNTGEPADERNSPECLSTRINSCH